MLPFKIRAFQLPALIARVGGRLPQWPHTLNLCAALNAALRLGLLDTASLEPLAGRKFRVTVQDTGGVAIFTYGNGWFWPLFRLPGEPDLDFRANLSGYLQLLARQEDPDTLFFNRQLSIEGDTELGLLVKNLLDAIEWPSFAARWQELREKFAQLRSLRPA
jgi:O2-independent ubiquinone biosynthesis accessory factor UbiT